MTLLKKALSVAACLVLVACATPDPQDDPPVDLGAFRLGHNIVVADNAKLVPPTREASPDEWEATLANALDARFRQYQGEDLYHFGISVDAYALALPGIPVLLAPKSVLVVSVNVWDNATQSKLTAEPKQLTIFEGLNGETVVGTGFTRTRQEQMAALSANAAQAIEKYLRENAHAWFGAAPLPEEQPVAEPAH